MAGLSKTQIDRLGDRLRSGAPTDADLRSLDNYRRSFGDTYELVVRTIRDRLHLEPTGRPAKSTASIVEKLRRESIRLTQVQDIAGCRVVVADMSAQDIAVASLCAAFPTASVVDRRVTPSYGYRAVHVIVHRTGTLVEVQVRSSLQHQWAEFSEKLSDVLDPRIKYGGGPTIVQAVLARSAELVAHLEAWEAEMVAHDDDLRRLRALAGADEASRGPEIHAMEQLIHDAMERLALAKAEYSDRMDEMISLVEDRKRPMQ